MASLTTTLAIPAIILGIIDGDTAKVRAYPWLPGWSVETSIRIRGIDTPELKTHASCASEGELGEKAKAFATAEFQGRAVILRDLAEDKYGGRVLGTITRTSDGVSWSATLLNAQLAHAYDGGTKQPWCP